MATVLANNKAIKHINVFQKQEFDLGIGGTTILKRVSKEFLEAQERWRIRDQKRKRKINKYCQELDDKYGGTDGLDSIKLMIKKDGAHFKLKTYIKFVNSLEEYYKDNSLVNEWENVAVERLDTICPTGRHIHRFRMNIPVFWTRRDGYKQTFNSNKHSCISESHSHLVEPQKTHDRNNTIADIREEHLSGKRRGPRGHEKQPFHYYRTDEDFKQFIQRVEQEGLIKEPEAARKEVYDFVGGFYYKVSLPSDKIRAERQLSEKELEAVKLKQLATLGGAEVDLK